MARRPDAAAHLRPLRADPARLFDRRISGRHRGVGCRQVGLCPDQLAARAFRGRSRLGAKNCAGDRLAARDRGLRRFLRTGRASAARPARALRSCARRSHAIALAREPALSLCGAGGSRRRSGPPPQHPPSRRVRLELRSPGLCQTDGWRSRSCGGLPERDLRAAARRHARGSLARGPRGMARRHGAPRGMPERCFQALRTRHFPAPKRSRPYRGGHARDGGNLRRQALPVRVEFPDREALDFVQARSSTPIARRRGRCPKPTSRRSCTTPP